MNKMQVAHQQLNVAIRLHFLDDDPASVLTLAGAAAGVFRDLVEHKHPGKSWDDKAIQASGMDRESYFKAMRFGQNFLKHADRDPDDTMEWTASDTESLIFWATLNAGELDGISTSQQVFQLWFFATRSKLFRPDFHICVTALKYFPGILAMTDREQRRFGYKTLVLQMTEDGEESQ
ncbi:MAG TPA: hypothetical protein VK641_03095 [Terriglobales bacterium]|nr:hypothetical protein [Terriglobales bacterium]